MNRLQDLPNIGRVAQELLIESGIQTPEELYEIGSKEAFLRIRMKDPTACIRMLYGLEGAVQGLKDHQLSKETKEELLEFFRTLR